VIPRRVLLVGMMGAGKTTVGRLLGERTGWPYLDNDELVALAAGRTTRAVLDADGALVLRGREAAALDAALSAPPPVIAAVAGGAIEQPEAPARLAAGGFVVWLRAGLATLAARVGSGGDRPWLDADPLPVLTGLYAGRAVLYRSAAALVVDVDRAEPGEIVDRIVARLAGPEEEA